MYPDEFYKSRKTDWENLAKLVEQSKSGLTRFSPDEIHQLGQLYRSATSDLALAQRDFPRHRVTQYLNNLVARAHAVVYRSEPLAFQRLKRFAMVGYPRLFRQAWPYMSTSFLVFIIPALVAGLIIRFQPDAARWLLPEQVQQLTSIIEEQELWTDIPVQLRPFASSFIMQNNIQVAILAFSVGILGGIFTIWVLLFNGLVLGGITGLTAIHGVGFELWTFVIGHGVVELSVIIIAGGTGLMLGWSVLHPGLLRRWDALTQGAQKAIRLLAGCIPLLAIAALIEGFLSPAENIPWYVKWAVGLGSGILLHGYLLLSGRGEDRNSTPGVRAGFSLSIPDND